MKTQLLVSATNPSGFPDHAHGPTRAEIALVGRSNVGKSSLLNSLVRSSIARTSRTPGRTQMINFFTVSGAAEYILVDLPGRGYARVPNSVRARWSDLVESYLHDRAPLRAVLFLLDARRGADDDDVALFRGLTETLGTQGAEVIVIMTKADKLSKAETKPAAIALARTLNIPITRVLVTSTTQGQGLDPLRRSLDGIARKARQGPRPT